ncbi:MAG: hypothetical protein K2N03_00420, partial [Muribaculaceae bacterium]|nr:hypothetical protein [Muribaculaceae bacterium]
MASLTICVDRKRKRKDGLYLVYVRVTHNGRTAYIKTDKVVSEKGLSPSWEVTDPFILKPLSTQVVEWLDLLNRQSISTWTARQVVDFLKSAGEELIFSDYARRYITAMKDNGQLRNARNYEMAVKSLELHACTNQVKFSQMTSAMISRWIKTYSPLPNGFAPDDESQMYCVREALVNFLAHADYFSEIHSTVRVYDNSIELQNPGSFPVDLKMVGLSLVSQPRNPN